MPLFYRFSRRLSYIRPCKLLSSLLTTNVLPLLRGCCPNDLLTTKFLSPWEGLKLLITLRLRNLAPYTYKRGSLSVFPRQRLSDLTMISHKEVLPRSFVTFWVTKCYTPRTFHLAGYSAVFQVISNPHTVQRPLPRSIGLTMLVLNNRYQLSFAWTSSLRLLSSELPKTYLFRDLFTYLST